MTDRGTMIHLLSLVRCFPVIVLRFAQDIGYFLCDAIVFLGHEDEHADVTRKTMEHGDEQCITNVRENWTL